MQELFVIPDCRVVKVEPVGAAGLHVAAQVKQSSAYCPSCERPSQSVHSRYHRHPVDLPSLGNAIHIDLLVRRFYCRNPVCPRRTFAEPVPELLSARARRTRRLASAQGWVGVTCGGEAGAVFQRARLGSWKFCGVPCEGALLSLVKTQAGKLSLQPEALGAGQEATNGLKHPKKRPLLGVSGPCGPQRAGTPSRPRNPQCGSRPAHETGKAAVPGEASETRSRGFHRGNGGGTHGT